jgi:PTH1 family peptidyl-tRNA hydrolase
MKLIVGLGNPGQEYLKTRHNIGFMVIDAIIKKSFCNAAKKFNSMYCKLNEQLICVMPQTYMNNSGIAVQSFCRFFKIKTEDVIVIHDDIDLELGKIKIKVGGGNGGHNGLKSIDTQIGLNYLRIRLGIGRPTSSTADYVLQNFTKLELEFVEKMIVFVSENIAILTKQTVSANEISRFLSDYSKTA